MDTKPDTPKPGTATAAAVKARSRRTVFAILLQSFLDGVVFWQPLHSLLLTGVLSDSAAAATTLLSIGATLTAVLEVPSGVLADLWGRRNTLVVASVFLVAAHALLLWVTAWLPVRQTPGLATDADIDAGTSTGASASWTPFALLCARAFCTAVSESLISGTNDALLYDVLLEESQQLDTIAGAAMGAGDAGVDDRFRKATAKLSMMWPLGATVASLLSGWMLSSWGAGGNDDSPRGAQRVVVAATLVPAAAGLVCALWLHEASPTGRTRDAAGVDAEAVADTGGGGDRLAKNDVRATAAVAESAPQRWIAHTARSLRILLGTPTLRIMALSTVGTVAFADGVHLINPLFFAAKGVHVAWLGLISSGMYGCSYLGSAGAPRAARAFGDKQALILSTVWMVTMNASAALVSGPAAAVCMSFSSLSWGLRWPIVSAMLNKHTPSAERATVASIQNLLTRVALAVTVPLAGIVVDHWSPNAAVLLSAAGVGAVGLLMTQLPPDVKTATT